MTYAQKNKKNNAARKAAVLNTANPKRKILLISAAALLLIATVWLAFALTDMGPSVQQAGGGTGVNGPKLTPEAVIFEVGMFDDGRAHFFEHSMDGLTVRYFILKSSDGVIRAAFDACDVCWRSRKGYRQDGDMMVCNNCQLRFASVLVNEVQGGCNPAPLTRSLQDGKLIIRLQDLARGKPYFGA